MWESCISKHTLRMRYLFVAVLAVGCEMMHQVFLSVSQYVCEVELFFVHGMSLGKDTLSRDLHHVLILLVLDE